MMYALWAIKYDKLTQIIDHLYDHLITLHCILPELYWKG